MEYIYKIGEEIIQFEIGYMINPSLLINKVFREQVKKYLRAKFHKYTMGTIRDVMKNKDTCVIALIMFYDSKGTKQKILYGVLSCVLYSFIENCVCINNLSFQSKTLSIFSFNRIF